MATVIEVKNLVKQYKKADAPAVNGISFEVQEGEFFSLLGPNGAGKTTTISILTTTLNKTSGVARIAGHDVAQRATAVRQEIGIIFQTPSLDLELTAEENIRLQVSLYGLHDFRPTYRMMPVEYRNRVEELAETLGLEGSLQKRTRTYSGGMMRKLEIMRSLMHRPRILFLDEPTQGLDAASRQSLWQYLHEIRERERITVFLTTHYLEEAEDADRICLMNKGDIAAMGTLTEIRGRLLRDSTFLMDAADRRALRAELGDFGVDCTETGRGLRVAYDGDTPQRLIARLETPLTMLDVRQPTLEEAYVELIERTGQEKQ